MIEIRYHANGERSVFMSIETPIQRERRLNRYCRAVRKAAKMRRIAYALHGVTADAERAFVPYAQPLRERS